jgi:hypothetical protein
VLEAIDRAIVRVNYGLGRGAIGGRFESLVTTAPRARALTDTQVTPESLAGLEASLRLHTTVLRKWSLVGAGIAVVLPLVLATGWIWLLTAVLLALPFGLIAWTAWIVVAVLGWRKTPEWTASDGLVLALKSGTLGPEALDVIRAMPADWLLRVALGPLLPA